MVQDQSTFESHNQGAELPGMAVEVEIYVNTDGSVTFADLASDLLELAVKLNPEDALSCAVRDGKRIGENIQNARTA